MKKIYGILLAGSMVLGGAGAVALFSPKGSTEVNAGVSSLYVGNQDIKTAGTISSGGGTCKYELINNVVNLTFNNFKFTGECYSYVFTSTGSCIYYEGDLPLVINVNGTNEIIDTKTGNTNTRGLFFNNEGRKGVTFNGNGSLALTAGGASHSSYGYDSVQNGTVTFNGPTVTFTAGSTTEDQSYHVNSVGLWADYKGSITINKGAVIANAGNAVHHSYGAYAGSTSGDKIIINGGYFEANGASSNNGKSYGIVNRDNSSFVNITSKANKVRFSGNNGAASGNFTHDVAGTGYYNKGGTGSYTSIDAGWGSLNSNIKCAILTNEIKETVTNYEGGRDGNPHGITVSVDKPGEYTIKYGETEGTYNLDTSPTLTEFGEKTVYYKITAPYLDVTEKTGSGTIKISKTDPTYVAPTAKELAYTGSAQALVNAGSSSEAIFQYRLGTTGEYAAAIPTATEPGNYQVYYNVIGDEWHNTLTDLGPVNVTIKKGTNEYVGDEPTGVAGLVYDGNSYELIDSSKEYSGTHGEVQYRLGTTGEFSTTIPTAVHGGTYVIYYKIVSNDSDHYEDSQIKSVSVTIAKATNDYVTKPTAITEELVYTGEPITLANAGEAEHGTILYKVDNGAWSENLPTAVSAGQHTVYFKLDGGTDYESYDIESFEVTIEKAEASFASKPAAIDGLVYTGEPLELIVAGETNDGHIEYSLSQEGPFSTDIPTATEVGEYTVYYQIIGDSNHNDSEVLYVKAAIIIPDKTALADKIKEAQDLYEKLKDNYPAVAETLLEAIEKAQESYDDQYLTPEAMTKAIKDLDKAINKAIADSRDIIFDENNIVTVETVDGTPIPTNVNLVVELRSKVKAKEGSKQYESIQEMLANDEEITNVYDIKLILKQGNVETEIQPSDIKEGLKLIVHISLPDGFKVQGMKLLHIHNKGNMEFIDDYKVDNGEIVFEISSLSELAFVKKVVTPLPAWAIALIIASGVILLLCLIYIFMFAVFGKWTDENNEVKRVAIVGKRDETKKVMFMNFKCSYRIPARIHKTKSDAQKALKK